MSEKRPLVLAAGRAAELAAGDTVAGVQHVAKYTLDGPLQANTGTTRWHPDKSITLTGCYVSLGVAGSGRVEIDVRKNGASVFTSRPSVAAGAYKSPVVTLNQSLTPSDSLTVDVKQAGGAKNAVVSLTYY